MFLRLFSIETTRLTRRTLPWLSLAAILFYIGLSMQNFYSMNQTELVSGGLKMPGISFDLANALDQMQFIALPFLVLLAANVMGNDYTQRTNQHWLMRAPRHTGVLAKFALLALFVFIIQLLVMLAGFGVGWYYKTFVYDAYSLANLNIGAMVAAPFYMTLSQLPYLAMILLFTIATRSTLWGAVIGLGYTQFIEILITSIFHGKMFMMLHPHNLAASVTFLLNLIGNRVVEPPDYLAQPAPSMIGLLVYTILFLAAALWLYRRQDVGG